MENRIHEKSDLSKKQIKSRALNHDRLTESLIRFEASVQVVIYSILYFKNYLNIGIIAARGRMQSCEKCDSASLTTSELCMVRFFENIL